MRLDQGRSYGVYENGGDDSKSGPAGHDHDTQMSRTIDGMNKESIKTEKSRKSASRQGGEDSKRRSVENVITIRQSGPEEQARHASQLTHLTMQESLQGKSLI